MKQKYLISVDSLTRQEIRKMVVKKTSQMFIKKLLQIFMLIKIRLLTG